MNAHATAHTHQARRYPAIEAHVGQTIYRIGAPPIYMLKPGTNPNEAQQVLAEVIKQWPMRAINMHAGQIVVWGCE